MFTWLKSLFGFDTPDTPVIAQTAQANTVAEDKPQTKKPTAKKSTTTKKKSAAKKPESTAPKKRGRPKKTAE